MRYSSKALSQKARKRISIATLYIGCEQLEIDLLDAIVSAAERSPQLKVTMLMEGTRCSRPVKSSATFTSSLDLVQKRLLVPLKRAAQVFFYQSPWLRSSRLKKLLGPRNNEILQLQHMKLYIFDDTVVLSGANLSHDYFTSRQDRAWIIRGVPELADFYHKFIGHVGSVSREVLPDRIIAEKKISSVTEFKDHVENFLMQYQSVATAADPSDTILVPTVQMGHYGVQHDEELMDRLFDSISRTKDEFTLCVSSGYFNPTNRFQNQLVTALNNGNCASLSLLCAAPEANGFLGADGFSGYIPAFYRTILGRFLQQVARTEGAEKFSAMEYCRPGWTFHAKGLLLETPKWTIASIGSSNFNARSCYRDLEAQLYLLTTNKSLRDRLANERRFLTQQAFCRPINHHLINRQAEHKLPLLLRFLVPIARSFL